MATISASNATDRTGELRALRRAAGLSQQQLALRADCSVSYFRMLEQGFAPERSNVVPRVLRALNDEDPGRHPRASAKNGDAAPHPTG